ncbi:MAG: hypothetical protein H6Q30_1726, partial [Bacteroidetes bacterium]|nr:hypothetical protein [Bacteroidota bacterium]
LVELSEANKIKMEKLLDDLELLPKQEEEQEDGGGKKK